MNIEHLTDGGHKIHPRFLQFLLNRRVRVPFLSAVRAFKKDTPKTFAALTNGLEKLRNERGAFIAANSDDYRACWIRDQLYATYAYYYLGEYDKYRDGIRVVFDILHKSKTKIERGACIKPEHTHDYIHAKFHAETYDEITNDWGHHQIDAIGLFLFMVGNAENAGLGVISSQKDEELIQLLVGYLTTVRYWEYPDNGMWEEWLDLHTSSIGAAVKGLTAIRDAGVAIVSQELIDRGIRTLFAVLPNESPERETDLAQLSLLWPYNVVPSGIDDVILERVTKRLVQPHGLNRYLDDNYYRSDNGVSAEWTFGFFWLAIIYADRGQKDQAREWFMRGLATMTPEGELPELYQNGQPNGNTPLAWSHSLALIAGIKLYSK